MKFILKKIKFDPVLLVIIFNLIIYFLAIINTANDKSFSERWLNLSIWALSICILPAYLLLKNIRSLNITKTLRDNYPYLFIIILLALIFNLIFLINYPFVSVYDEVRDGGLHAKQITDGTIKNIFSYGRYESHGLTIPVITSFFYRIFQNSVLTFRLPAAIISILDITILYFLIRKTVNSQTAFWGALILTTIPLHLFYARTEVVVIFSSILTTLALLGISYFIKYKNYKTYSLLGLFLGFASGFHTSARTVSMLTIIVVILITLLEIFLKKIKRKFIIVVLFLIIFYFIGFGPRILFTTSEIFFQSRSFSLSNQENKNTDFSTKIEKVSQNYVKAILVYFKEPTISTHYPDFKPILNPVLGILFLIGFIYSLLSKNTFLKYVCIYALILPLTNSAITEAVNSDNRLAPLFPISAILSGVGIYFLYSNFKKIIKFSFLKIFLNLVIFIFILSQGFNFFLNETATKQYIIQDYLFMHTIYTLREDRDYKNTNNICFFVSPDNYNWLSPWYNVLKTEEQFQYFLPNKYIYVLQNSSILDNQIYISSSCNQNLEKENFYKATYCSPYKKFECPPTNNTTIEIYSENSSDPYLPDIEKLKAITPTPLLIDPNPQFVP